MTYNAPDLDRVIERSLPPQDIELECQILGGLLLDPTAIARIASDVPPEAFYLTSHQQVYKACLVLHKSDRPVDMMTVTIALVDGGMEPLDARKLIAALTEYSVSAVNIDYHGVLLLNYWQRRRLINYGAEVARSGWEPDVKGAIAKAEAGLFQISMGANEAGSHSAGDLSYEVFSDAERRLETGELPGIPSGFYDLDSMTQGFQPGDLIIAAGRPAMGKTSFVMNLARNIAAIQKPVLVFSLEMSKKQLMTRMIGSECSLETGAIRSPSRLSEDQWGAFAAATAKIGALDFEIHDKSAMSVPEIRTIARKFAMQRDGNLGLIVVDYLQLLGDDGSSRSGDRVQVLSKMTRDLKGLAKELNCPVIALSQLSRGVESRTNKRPMMSDLRESGSIEQDADLIIMLYRDEYYNPDTQDRGVAEVIITKHRNGPVGTVKLLFEPQFTRFRNLAAGGVK